MPFDPVVRRLIASFRNSSHSSEALAGPCRSEACGRGYNCCSPRLAGCSECSRSDLEQAVDEDETGTLGQNERTMAGAVDRGDRLYV